MDKVGAAAQEGGASLADLCASFESMASMNWGDVRLIYLPSYFILVLLILGITCCANIVYTLQGSLFIRWLSFRLWSRRRLRPASRTSRQRRSS